MSFATILIMPVTNIGHLYFMINNSLKLPNNQLLISLPYQFSTNVGKL